MTEPSKGERTAQRIMDAAEVVFAAKGYEAASRAPWRPASAFASPGSTTLRQQGALSRGATRVAAHGRSMVILVSRWGAVKCGPGRPDHRSSHPPSQHTGTARRACRRAEQGAEMHFDRLAHLMLLGRRVNKAAGPARRTNWCCSVGALQSRCGYFWGTVVAG